MKKQESKQPIIKNGKKIFKVDCVVADETDSIKLVLWEKLIDEVECGKSYLFKGVTCRIFDDVKYLNTNYNTTIEARDNIMKVNLKSSEMQDNVFEARCIGVHIKEQQACVICNSTTEFDTNSEDLVTCPHCENTILATICTTKLVSSLTLQTSTGELKTFTCFNDAIQSFLASLGKDISLSMVSHKELQKLFLSADKLKMIVDKSSAVIYQFLS